MTRLDQINDMDLATAKKVEVPSGLYQGKTIAAVGRSKAGREWLHNARQLFPVKEGTSLDDPRQLFAVAVRVYIVKTE